MAKKQKERSETEHLRSIIKNQRSIIKHLQKQVGRNKKREQQEDLIAEELLEDEFKERDIIADNKCPECIKGQTEVVDLKVRKMVVCNSCNYRKVIK